MNLRVDLDTRNFSEWARRVVRQTNRETLPFLREQGRLLVQQGFLRVTVPRKAPRGKNVQYLTGAAATDIKRSAMKADAEHTTIERLSKAVRIHNADTVRAIVKNLPGKHSWAGRNVILNGIKGYHRSNQDSFGRVRGHGNNLEINPQAVETLRTAIGNATSKLRAGWNPSAVALGVKRGMRRDQTRHGNRYGQYSEDRRGITMTNNAVRLPGYFKTVQKSVEIRVRVMRRDFLKFANRNIR